MMNSQEEDTIRIDSLVIKKSTHSVLVDDTHINLTSTEFEIFISSSKSSWKSF